MKRNLPPLNALRAFEASARLNSMQRAAHELNVTPSAISQQVQNLEQWVGFPLLERRARQVQANAEGRAYRVPTIPKSQRGRRLTRKEEDEILGFGPEGA